MPWIINFLKYLTILKIQWGFFNIYIIGHVTSQNRYLPLENIFFQIAIAFLCIFLLFYIMIFFIIDVLQCSVNFLLYSKVTHLHIHVEILFSHTILLHHKWLDIVPSATQQDLIDNPFPRHSSASINSKLPIQTTPSAFPLTTYSLSPWFSFLWKGLFVPYIRLQI